jgi:hypothetical protein
MIIHITTVARIVAIDEIGGKGVGSGRGLGFCKKARRVRRPDGGQGQERSNGRNKDIHHGKIGGWKWQQQTMGTQISKGGNGNTQSNSPTEIHNFSCWTVRLWIVVPLTEQEVTRVVVRHKSNDAFIG